MSVQILGGGRLNLCLRIMGLPRYQKEQQGITEFFRLEGSFQDCLVQHFHSEEGCC